MIEKMIREARSQRASDIHISEGQAVYLRIDGKLIKSDLELSDEMTRKLILSLLILQKKARKASGMERMQILHLKHQMETVRESMYFVSRDASRQQFVCLTQKYLHSLSFICRQCLKILQMSQED